MVAPATGPKPAISPTTVTGTISPPTTIRVSSPIARPEVASVVDSRAISSAPCGARPATTSWAGSSGKNAKPKLGAPPEDTAVPSAPTRTTPPVSSGRTTSTPSTAASSVTRVIGTRSGPGPPTSVTSWVCPSAARTYVCATVVPETSSSKVADIIVRSENVPETNATPSATASRDRANFTRCARTARRATRRITRPRRCGGARGCAACRARRPRSGRGSLRRAGRRRGRRRGRRTRPRWARA